MVAQIPKGVYTMKTKRAIIKHNAAAYRKATKKAKSMMLDELAVIGALGGEPGAYHQGLKGILVEIARDDEVMRTLTDNEGRFAFLAIRPGTWKFKVYDHNIPEYHYIETPEMDIVLPPGGEEEITVKVLPRKRRIQMIEEGVIISK